MKIERHFIPKILQAFRVQINTFIQAIKEHGYEYAKTNIFIIVPFEPIAKVIKELYLKSAYIEANDVLGYLRKRKKKVSGEIVYKRFDFEKKKTPPVLGLGFEELAPLIDQYFQIRLLNLSALPITATTRQMIQDKLIAEVERGVPLKEAIDNFIELAISSTDRPTLSAPRAARIARTETTKALSFGGLIGAYMSGVDVDKVWVTSDDERVRGFWPVPYTPYKHTVLDLREADLMGSFYNGEKIRYPGDTEASIENIINCRCSMYFKEKSNPEDLGERLLENFLIEFGIAIGITVGVEELIFD